MPPRSALPLALDPLDIGAGIDPLPGNAVHRPQSPGAVPRVQKVARDTKQLRRFTDGEEVFAFHAYGSRIHDP